MTKRTSESDGQTKKKFVIKTEKSPGIINTVIIPCGRGAKHLDRNAQESNYKIAIYYARDRVVTKEKKMSIAVASITAGTGMVIVLTNPKASYY